MKILHVIHSLDPRSGGPSHAIRELIREQVRVGHDVTVLATTTQSGEPWEPRKEFTRRMKDDLAFQGAEVCLARAYGRGRPFRRYAYSPVSSRWLRQRTGDSIRRPEIVHIHATFSHLTRLAALWARRESIPYIVRPAGNLDAKPLKMGNHWLKLVFSRLWLMNDLEQAAWIQTTSPSETRELLKQVSHDRVKMIPHGVVVPDIEKTEAVTALTARFPQLTGRRIILFMSRIHAIKRPELLVEAIARLLPSFDDLVLLLAGNDAGHLTAVRDAIHRLNLDDHVVVAGFLQGEIKHMALAGADVFVLPSLHENFGMAVAEAMAHGTPVVITPGVGIHGYVDQSNAGLTVDDNVESLTAGIRQLFQSDASQMGRNGRDFIKSNWTWPEISRQLDQLYVESKASDVFSSV